MRIFGIVLTVALFSALIAVYILPLVKLKLRRPDEDIIDDPEELSRAEDRTNVRSTWTVIKTLGSNNGFNDNDMMRIISFLGSREIEATYSASGVGLEGGAIMQYLVKVRPDQEEKAREVLAEYLQR